MNELERMLRADLHDVAGTVEIPVRLDAVAAVRDRMAAADHRTRWGRIALAAAVVAALVLAAVWFAQAVLFRTPDTAVPNPLQTPSEPAPAPSADPSAQPPTTTPSAVPATPSPSASAAATPVDPGGRTVGMFVYFAATESFPNLVREVRQVPAQTPARGALEAMLAGPSDPESVTLWNPDTKILGISEHADLITVDLSREAEDFNLGAAYEGYMVDQLVYTITEAFQPTFRVLITIEGRPFVTGHNVYDQPLTRGEGTDSPIRLVIDTPAQDATVSSPVRVTGLAAAFEATLMWEVRGTGPEAPVVAEGVAQTDEGMVLAPFAFDLPPLGPGTYVLRITLDDPSAGEAGPAASETKVFSAR